VLYRSFYHRDPPSFPTRRSSDLRERQIVAAHFVGDVEIAAGVAPFRAVRSDSASSSFAKLREQMSELVSKRAIDLFIAVIVKQRSEEHTSEPSHQIISYAVFCLK